VLKASAESKTVVGTAQAPRVGACQGFYCPGCIQPTKQTKKKSFSAVRGAYWVGWDASGVGLGVSSEVSMVC